jgi:hypothetical protein
MNYTLLKNSCYFAGYRCGASIFLWNTDGEGELRAYAAIDGWGILGGNFQDAKFAKNPECVEGAAEFLNGRLHLA